MLTQLLGDVVVVRLDRGDEVIQSVLTAAAQYHIQVGQISGIGAASEVTFGVLSSDNHQYQSRTMREDLEITNLTGNLTTKDGAAYLHLHITLGTKSGQAFGGHLNAATVGATSELFIRILPGTIGREMDESVGINLMRF